MLHAVFKLSLQWIGYKNGYHDTNPVEVDSEQVKSFNVQNLS